MEQNTQEAPGAYETKQELDLSFNLLDVVASVWRWRKWILILSVLAVVGAVVTTLLLPNYYTAQATVLPGNEEKDLFGKEGKNNSIIGDEDAVNRALIFANSQPLVEFMITEFDLAKRYNINVSTPKGEAKVSKRFRKLYNVKKNEHSGIEISIQDTDPEMAAKMVSRALIKVEELYKQATEPNKQMILEVYENALKEKRKELREVADSLIFLRRKYKIYDIKTQGEMLASAVVNTEAQLAENTAKLQAYRQSGGRPDSIANISARVKGLQYKLDLLNNQSDSVQSAMNLRSFNQGRELMLYFENQLESLNDDIADILSEYTRFGAQAKSKASALIVLEPVQIPKVKSYPVRSIIVIAALFLALVIGVMGALILDLNKRIDWQKVLRK